MRYYRDIKNGDILGGFTYKVILDWAKRPEHLAKAKVNAVATDSKGFVYAFSRDLDHPVIVFDPDGNFVKTWGEGCFTSTHGIYISKDDIVYCSDYMAHCFYLFDLDGNRLGVIGTPGVPGDCGADLTQTNHRNRLWSAKKLGTPFCRPTKIVQGPSGDLYASDGYANSAVHRFSKDGQLKKTWGGLGIEGGELYLPHGIWVDENENVWVADKESSRLDIFTGEGVFLKRIDWLMRPSEVAGDGKGNIYVAELDGGVTIFNLSGHVQARFGHYLSAIRPHGICVDEDGNIFMAQFQGNDPIVKMERL